MEIKSSEFFRNIKKLPPTESKAWYDLKEWEKDKCLGGVTVNGIFFSGWLYWHLNHWHIGLDGKDKFDNPTKVPGKPVLRDNEWLIAEGFERARRERKGLMVAGSRRLGKSEAEASICMYHTTLFENTQNIIVGGDEGDLGLLKAKIDFGNQRVWDGLQIPKLDNDWRKPMIKMGFKNVSGGDEIWSYIVLRNVVKGQNTEGPAGVTARSFIGDEIAKYPFSSPFEAAKPSFLTTDGWGCTPILVCTGGNAEKFADAERYFFNPESNNFVHYIDEKSGKRTGLFLSGLYRPDFKDKTNLFDYLVDKGDITPDMVVMDSEYNNYSELKKIDIDVCDKLKGITTIMEERKQKAADPDQTDYLKQVMYYPLEVEECFMTAANNFYSSDLAKTQKERIADKYPDGKVGMYVELLETEINGEIKITHKPSAKLPISSYPRKHNENRDTPIVILEHPITNPPWGLYTCGVDPFRFAQAKTSNSEGAAYIFKRQYDILSDTFQDMFVAWYVGNPKDKKDWNNNVRLLIEYYNAVTLVENDEYSFCQYMIDKDRGHYLLDTPEWIKEFNPKSVTGSRQKGISAAPKNIELLMTTFKQYMEEHFTTTPDKAGGEGKKLLGISKIFDPILLEEIIKWNSDNNTDRERASSLALLCARKLDAQKLNVVIESNDPRDTMFSSASMKKSGKGVNIDRLFTKKGSLMMSLTSIQRLFK